MIQYILIGIVVVFSLVFAWATRELVKIEKRNYERQIYN